ncbi:hypothetical protein K443DRAFT_103686, partial [Laccaria amethystina LaAM-08-1]
ILDDEDFARDIQLHLLEIGKKGYICAQDIVDYVATPEVQTRLGTKARTIHEQTACRWLKKLNWRYTRKKKGMYIDSHEQEDVVAYRTGFIKRWKEYEKCFLIRDNDGQVSDELIGFPVTQIGCFCLILVTHDESTFYANDCRKTKWVHATEAAVAEAKGEGVSLMVSDLVVPEWGHSCDGAEYMEFFSLKYKLMNRDGWFSSEDLLAQVDKAIDIFEGRTNRFATGLFM